MAATRLERLWKHFDAFAPLLARAVRPSPPSSDGLRDSHTRCTGAATLTFAGFSHI